MAKSGILDEKRLASTVPARSVDSLDATLDTIQQAIMQRAYARFEARGPGLAGELDDWLEAERELFWQPPASVRERDGTLEITIAMPGVATEDVDVQVSGHEVLVQSSGLAQDDDACTAVHTDELPRGRALRVIRVATPLQPERASATLRDGLLCIRVPLAEEAAARTVPVAA